MTNIELLETKVRATRRVSSVPLVVIGIATVVAAVSPLFGDVGRVVGFVVAPLAAFAFWVVMKVTSTRAGLGMGRERYGLIAVIVVVVSLSPLVSILFGPAFLLGVLLLAAGWRAEDRRQWVSGLVLAIASPLLSYSFIQNQIYVLERSLTGWYWFTDMTADGVILAAIGVVLLLAGIAQFRRENEALRRRSE